MLRGNQNTIHPPLYTRILCTYNMLEMVFLLKVYAADGCALPPSLSMQYDVCIRV